MKLGFLFLTRDNVHHPDIWEEFFGAEIGRRCVVRMHPKPESVDLIDPWWRRHVIADLVETGWGELSIVTAMNRLLRAALEDTKVERFILLSESAIPIRSFDDVYERMAREPKSVFCYSPDAECWPRCESLLRHLPSSMVKKSHQWAILNRKHAQLIVDLEAKYLPWFEDVFAADEHFWICVLHHLGLDDEIADWMSTYVEWRADVPRAFDRLAAADIDSMLESDAFFARKFSPGSNARRLWRRVRGESVSSVRRAAKDAPRESIWLFGDARSGTSWLADIINHDQRLSYYFEPLHFGDAELTKRVRGLHRLKYMPVELQDPALEEVVEEILARRFGTSRTPVPPPGQGVLVKDIYANLMTAWLHERWPSTKKVLLIRHPFAVACSKLRLDRRHGWRFVRRPAKILAQRALREDFLAPLELLFSEVAEGFEEYVLVWAVNHYVPLRQLSADDVHVVFYEELLEDPQPTLDGLFQYLHGDEWERHRWPAPKAVFEAPSRMAQQSGGFSLDGWKSMVRPSERRRGREILRCFGLDGIYVGEARPRRAAVDAILRGESAAAALPDVAEPVLWLDATVAGFGGRHLLLIGAEGARGEVGKSLEARGWSVGAALTAMDPLDLRTRSAQRLAASGPALVLDAVCVLSRSPGESTIAALGGGEATIQLATALIDVEHDADSAMGVLGRLATRVASFRLSFASAEDGAGRLEAEILNPLLANSRQDA